MLGIMFNIWSVVSDHQISVLATLQYKCFENSNVQPRLERMIFSPGVFGLIISEEDPNLEVAYAICRVALEEAELLSIGVVPNKRGSGYGKTILSAIITEAGHRGAESLVLEVGENNLAAKNLYAAAGFAQVGGRKNYYRVGSGAYEDAAIMRCRLRNTGVSSLAP